MLDALLTITGLAVLVGAFFAVNWLVREAQDDDVYRRGGNEYGGDL